MFFSHWIVFCFALSQPNHFHPDLCHEPLSLESVFYPFWLDQQKDISFGICLLFCLFICFLFVCVLPFIVAVGVVTGARHRLPARPRPQHHLRPRVRPPRPQPHWALEAWWDPGGTSWPHWSAELEAELASTTTSASPYHRLPPTAGQRQPLPPRERGERCHQPLTPNPPAPPSAPPSPSPLPPNLSLFFSSYSSLASRMQQQRTRDQAGVSSWVLLRPKYMLRVGLESTKNLWLTMEYVKGLSPIAMALRNLAQN